MRKIMRPIERFLFGATAEERVEMQMTIIETRVMRTLAEAFEALNDEEEEETTNTLPDESELWITNVRRPAGWVESNEA